MDEEVTDRIFLCRVDFIRFLGAAFIKKNSLGGLLCKSCLHLEIKKDLLMLSYHYQNCSG